MNSHHWLVNAWSPQWLDISPDSKVHGANMRHTWVLSAPDGPRVGPMNLAIRVTHICIIGPQCAPRSLKTDVIHCPLFLQIVHLIVHWSSPDWPNGNEVTLEYRSKIDRGETCQKWNPTVACLAPIYLIPWVIFWHIVLCLQVWYGECGPRRHKWLPAVTATQGYTMHDLQSGRRRLQDFSWKPRKWKRSDDQRPVSSVRPDTSWWLLSIGSLWLAGLDGGRRGYLDYRLNCLVGIFIVSEPSL